MAKSSRKSLKEDSDPSDPLDTIERANGLAGVDPNLPPRISLSGGDPFDMVAQVSQSLLKDASTDIVNNVVEKTRNQSEIRKIESEQRLKEVRGETSSPRSSPSPGLGLPGIGGMSDRAAIVNALLSKIPPEQMDSWLDRNKDLLLNLSSPVSSFGGMRPSGGSPSGGDPGALLAGVAAIVQTLGSESRLNAMSQQAVPSQSGMQQGGADLLTFVRELATNNLKVVERLSEGFSRAQEANQKLISDMQSETRKATLDLQEKLMSAKEESATTIAKLQMDSLNEKIAALSKPTQVPSNIVTLDMLPKIMEMSRGAGIPLVTETPEQERARRQFELDEKQMDFEHQKELAYADAEHARQQRLGEVTDLFGGVLGAVVQSHLERGRLNKSLKQGDSGQTKSVVDAFGS